MPNRRTWGGGGYARQLISADEPAACLTDQYEPGSWRILVLCRLPACLLACLPPCPVHLHRYNPTALPV
jgi:hypothetical protein